MAAAGILATLGAAHTPTGAGAIEDIPTVRSGIMINSDTSSSDTSSSSDINHSHRSNSNTSDLSHRRSSRRVRHRLRPVAVRTRKRDFASSECWVSSHDAKCPQKW